jgi:hypothetical protein
MMCCASGWMIAVRLSGLEHQAQPTKGRRQPDGLNQEQRSAVEYGIGDAEPSPALLLARGGASARIRQAAAGASDDAVLTQARDRGGVKAKPIGKHFGGMLA